VSNFVPFPETPALAEARIVEHPESGSGCLLARTEDGQRVAFCFEVDGEEPGLVIVDPNLWLEAGERPSDTVAETQADDWLQAVVSNPVGSTWLGLIKREHPDAYHDWFAQTGYDEGGEQGSG
jgi:hypothetical protein